MVEVLNGQEVTLQCQPSNNNLELQWTYTTMFDTDNNVDALGSRFQNQSSLLHQLTIPVANITDSGNYTCTIKGLPDGITVSQTIILTVLSGE